MAQHYLLYGHGGSFNHGGEALTSTTIDLLRQGSPGCFITLSTHFSEQDKQFKINADEFVERNQKGKTNEEIYAPTLERIRSDSICIHLGGDNYCYPNWQRYAAIHYKALEKGAVSILWSCSIDPKVIDNEMLCALKTHHLIAAREQITYDALLAKGLKNVVKVSDIAFTLKPSPIELELKNYVAINFGPLVIRKNPLLEEAFQALADYIIKKTELNLVLIPHVLASVDNDYEALKKIRVSDPARTLLISDALSAAQYKSIISQARFGVFSRTHAAIAAYSSLTPVLAVGYSSKSQGIAMDLKLDEFTLSIEQISTPQILIHSVQKLQKNELFIRQSLGKQMPQYIKKVTNVSIRKLLRLKE